MPSRPSHPTLSPNASLLRHRAIALRSFADTIDHLLVTNIVDHELHCRHDVDRSHHRDHADEGFGGNVGPSRWQVRHQLLERNLHQLHRAADELRDVAHQLWQRADGLELAHNVALTPTVTHA